DPKVFSRPWKISMPLYRRAERNARLLEFRCVEFAEELLYGHLRKKPSIWLETDGLPGKAALLRQPEKHEGGSHGPSPARFNGCSGGRRCGRVACAGPRRWAGSVARYYGDQRSESLDSAIDARWQARSAGDMEQRHPDTPRKAQGS